MIRHLTYLTCAIIAASILAAFAVEPDAAALQSRTRITIGKDTTFLTSPLRPDGTVNYVAAIEALRGRIAQQDNAFFLIMQIGGSSDRVIGDEARDELFVRFNLKKSEDLWKPFVPEVKTYPESDKEIEALFDLRYSPWLARQHPHFADWIQNNEKALAMLAEAAKYPQYMHPLLGDQEKFDWVALYEGRVSWYSDAMLIRATLRLAEGDVKGALEDTLTVHRLGRLIGRDWMFLNTIIGVALEAKAARTDAAIAASGKLSAKEALAHLHAIDALPEIRTVPNVMNFEERCIYLDYAAQIERATRTTQKPRAAPNNTTQPKAEDKKIIIDEDMGEIPFSREELAGVNFDSVLRAINKQFDASVAALKLNDITFRDLKITIIENEQNTMRAKAEDKTRLLDSVTDRFTNWFIGKNLASYSHATLLQQRNAVFTDLARLSLALAAYHADQNTYPDKLDSLKDKYITEIPADRFSHDPLIYKRDDDGYLLYSVGEDLKDDGGTPQKKGLGDIVVRSKN